MSARLGRFVWDGPYGGSFEPEGAIASHGTDGPRVPPVLAARIVLEFAADADTASAHDEMIQVARDVRARQVPADTDPLVMAQMGAYRRREPSGHFRREAGGQVVVLAPHATSRPQFEADMVELGETIARWFGQRIVVLDLQQDGVTQIVHSVSP